MNRFIVVFVLLLSGALVSAQSPFNIRVTNTTADAVLRGAYDPGDYAATDPVDFLDRIICEVVEDISTDSLESLIQKMQDFQTRNTYSDTVSQVRGIGAARRWVHNWFSTVSIQNENRLIPSYLEFEMPSSAFCGPGLFRNIFAVLPGRDAADPSAILIEGHMDSRCEVLCDTSCYAPGAEDNASGTALVMELSRLLSKYTFDHTLIFLVTVGEEQGLFGAEAFADYCLDEGIQIKAVQNNDVSGGVICGPSSSPPSCPGLDHIDSTSIRIFSQGIISSPHKDYARFIKTIHKEKSDGALQVPMAIRLMQPEDRTGRGGDHIPFRENGFRAVRITAANEHGDANVADPDYEGRQHTTRDIIGEDLDGNGSIDDYYVDFNYLKRSAVINAASMAAAALGPEAPAFTLDDNGLRARITITDPLNMGHYRIGVRQFAADFIALYEITDTLVFDIPDLEPSTQYRVTVSSLDNRGVSSLYASEINFSSLTNSLSLDVDTALLNPLNCATVGFPETEDLILYPGITMDAVPNPFDNYLNVKVSSKRKESISNAAIIIYDAGGTNIWSSQITISSGTLSREIQKQLPAGVYTVSLWVNEAHIRTVRAVSVR